MGLLLRKFFSDCLMQLKKQKRQELIDDSFVVPAGKGVFPGEKLKEVVAVFRVRQGKRSSEQGKRGDGSFIGVKTTPVVCVTAAAGPIVDWSVGGEENSGACRIFLQPVRRAEKCRRAGEKKQPAVMPLGNVKNKVLHMRSIVFHISDMIHGYLRADRGSVRGNHSFGEYT